MNLTGLLALIMSVLMTASAALAGDHAPINVATYNLRLNTPNDGPNVWGLRREAVKALIHYHEFDLFGTQEALPEQIKDLEALSEYTHVDVGRDDGKNAGEHSAIFYRSARFALLTHGDFWLSETPGLPSKGWDTRCCNRLATWVRLQDKTNGKTLLAVSVHFDHEGEVARRESAKLLLRWLKSQGAGDAVIALGDFNSTPDTEQILAMKTAMRDARTISVTPAYGPLATFNDFKFGLAPIQLIDYIFLGPNIRVLKYAVLTDSDGQRYPSDHFPVLARIELE
ncbi:MAG TPA: endonuclease/exonuclease/phosphatase family protein [Novimethylophilus sp.]|uniref:endonuclease/exonuclease/phosphatase family protein n=1 Tax=Novimethylophilus sp. TaxID=2137426 RepID=UPI002F41E333